MEGKMQDLRPGEDPDYLPWVFMKIAIKKKEGAAKRSRPLIGIGGVSYFEFRVQL